MAYATSNTATAIDFTGLSAGTHTLYARIIDKDDGFNDYVQQVMVDKATSSVTL